jgi:hypothetical protein
MVCGLIKKFKVESSLGIGWLTSKGLGNYGNSGAGCFNEIKTLYI